MNDGDLFSLISKGYDFTRIGMGDAKVHARIDKFIPILNKYMGLYEINTKLRVCHFLAQLLHESGGFRYVEELASGEAYDTGKLAQNLGNTPEKDGDGQLYKGRGLIQLTGRANYRKFGEWLKQTLNDNTDVYGNPLLLKEPKYAVLSAIYYWQSRKLNTIADTDDIKAVTKKVNGGYNGLADREAIYKRLKSNYPD